MMLKRKGWILLLAAIVALALAAWVTPKVLRRLDMQGLRPVTVAKGWSPPGRSPSGRKAGRP